MDNIEKIMLIVDELESQDKSALIQDLLVKLGDEECNEILYRLSNNLNILSD